MIHTNILFSTSGCIQENDIEYSLGAENDIAEVQGLTQQGCAELAATTAGALFWTYKSYQNRCYVKKTNGGRRYQLYAGLVSGNRECGVTGEDPSVICILCFVFVFCICILHLYFVFVFFNW